MATSRELRDLAAACPVSALLFASGLLVPVFGAAAGFFSAAPLVWLAARDGRASGALGGLLATALLLPLLPPPVVLIFAVEHAAPAAYLGWRLRAGRGIVAGSAAAALVITLLVTIAALLFAGRGEDPVRLLELQLREGLAQLRTADQGGPEAAGAAALDAGLEQLLALVRRALPALTLIGVFLECCLNSLIAARLLPSGEAAPSPRRFTAFALPEWLVWVLIPALALCWAPQRAVATAALNVTLPLLLGYLLQGLSIMLHLADRARVTRLGRTIIACGVVFFPWLLAVPLLFGLLDFRFAFRQRWPSG